MRSLSKTVGSFDAKDVLNKMTVELNSIIEESQMRGCMIRLERVESYCKGSYNTITINYNEYKE